MRCCADAHADVCADVFVVCAAQAAVSIAEFVQRQLWDPQSKRLRRAFCKAPSKVEGEWTGSGPGCESRGAELLFGTSRLECV